MAGLGEAHGAPVEVVAGVLQEGGRFLVALRPDRGSLPNVWEFPGGKVESGESHETALRRELQEELGISISVGDRLSSTIHRYPHGTIRLSSYQVFREDGTPRTRVHRELRWVALPELRALSLAPADLPILSALEGESP